MNVYQRINEVRKAVAYIKKEKAVQTYKAVEHDAVVAIVREHFVTQGIITYPEQVRGLMNPAGQKASKDGSGLVPDPMRLYEGAYKIHFVNIDDPADRLTVDIEAHAIDNGDKAPGKAVTYATKAALLKVLMLETGESDESRAEASRTLSEDQAATLQALIDDVNADKAAFLKYMGSLCKVAIASIEDIPAKAYQDAVAQLNRKRKAGAK